MFENFVVEDIDVGEAIIHVRHAGRGKAVLLLHGHPRTGATWHRVAPALVELGFRVVVPDLRGYGASRGPAPAADHAPASKRAMARDLVVVMDALGIGRFSVAGHDRGSYVAYRIAMDHPRKLTRLALLDCLPIVEHLERTDAAFATAWWHWFFFAQPEIPERVINADPDAWYDGDAHQMGQENYEEWRGATRNPDVVRAMVEDYRAGLTIDRRHEEADRAAGRKIEAPLLLLWSLGDDLEQLHGNPLEIWRRGWALDASGHGIHSGHHMAEEAPEALTAALAGFFGEA
ncbi:alpha/beta fold hydrolase [Arthrobacter sp. JSM 101049]|uniref:alpha/beta fold hydrolase n=1 Tax=Arthrobacter sp. JSM 101049 TaxID=929097 RepID=UPI0035645F18